MEWIPIVSVMLGGVIASGSTLLADRVRWRRESQQRAMELRVQEDRHRQELRHEVYAKYLAALSSLRNGLREVAHDRSLSNAQRVEKLKEVFLNAGAYEVRFQVQIIAPDSVIECSEAAYKSLRKLRIRIEEGATYEDVAYLSQRDDYHNKVTSLRVSIREDLRASE